MTFEKIFSFTLSVVAAFSVASSAQASVAISYDITHTVQIDWATDYSDGGYIAGNQSGSIPYAFSPAGYEAVIHDINTNTTTTYTQPFVAATNYPMATSVDDAGNLGGYAEFGNAGLVWQNGVADGGHVFTGTPAVSPGNLRVKDLHIDPVTGNGVAVGTTKSSDSTIAPAVWTTTNGGNTWAAAQLPALTGNTSTTYNGQIALAANVSRGGVITGADGTTAAVWTPNGSGGYHITQLPGVSKQTVAAAANDKVNSTVVGYDAAAGQAVVWTDTGAGFGTPTFVPAPSGFTSAFTDINNGNVAVGWINDSSVGSIGTPPFNSLTDQFGGNAIVAGDAGGTNFGSGTATDNGHAAVIWDDVTGLVDLNTITNNLSPGWKLKSAVAINEDGSILVNADDATGLNHAVVLTPIPEPGTLTLALGLAGLVLLVRRRRA